ncbi:MAG TPA: type II 3-dehydroquinate dehydratase [Chitinophagales bacterium]|nr:type II 3-dehydroquinate dehydratase [Chitinophagales bacterium]
MKILIINGPNLNLLGKREPRIYGNVSFEEFFKKLQSEFPKVRLEYFQSNTEGELINKLHETGFTYDGIVLNAGGYTHTSVALADAVAAIPTPVIEVHITNPKAREKFRHRSLLAPKCKGTISGLGLDGYRFAVELLLEK